MKEILKLSLVQSDLFWEDKKSNLDRFSGIIAKEVPEDIDLIILPEMFNTGFTMDSEKFAETMDGESVEWMRRTAKEKDAVITGSLIIKDEANFYNRMVWMQPDGRHHFYNKRHLFRMAKEHEYFSPGKEKVIVELKGWKICLMVCYDLRFPVWSRNVENFDLLIYVANWPERRNFAWRSLLVARAIENLCYVAGVNRVGKDGKDINYSGDSALVDYLGNHIASASPSQPETLNAEINYSELAQFREAFPAHLDADTFEIKH